MQKQKLGHIANYDMRFMTCSGYGKRFLIDEGVYKELTLNLYVEK
jgi:hypothetical protein